MAVGRRTAVGQPSDGRLKNCSPIFVPQNIAPPKKIVVGKKCSHGGHVIAPQDQQKTKKREGNKERNKHFTLEEKEHINSETTHMGV